MRIAYVYQKNVKRVIRNMNVVIVAGNDVAVGILIIILPRI